MSYSIYSVEGLLLDDRKYGEAGRLLFILTPDSGLMTLLAVGVREQKSKLRHLLSVGSVSTFEFVEGKEVKRLTSTFPIRRYENIFSKLESRNVFSHVVNFLLKNAIGEIDSKDLYSDFILGLDFTENNKDKDLFEIIEIIIIVNLLTNLGYWSASDNFLFIEKDFDNIKENKQKIIDKINKSIHSTQI